MRALKDPLMDFYPEMQEYAIGSIRAWRTENLSSYSAFTLTHCVTLDKSFPLPEPHLLLM